ncbi:MAG: DivIVA domain-containing protein [Actinophytocola sp.]|uniref:DivIVA domain-containing protein n=1 Tax=Actinophytocola sp. TaxID=1872138 RepID=UPI003C78B671
MSELTPDEIRSVVFDHAPMLRRGYDETQVDEFLDRVETAMISLQRAVSEKQQVLDQVALRPSDPHGPQTAVGKDHHVLADQIITDARRRADQIVENARTAAQRLVEEARAEAFRLVANASRQIAGEGGAGSFYNERERELTAAAAEVGDRIAQIRDALTAEVSYLYEIVDHMNVNTD